MQEAAALFNGAGGGMTSLLEPSYLRGLKMIS